MEQLGALRHCRPVMDLGQTNWNFTRRCTRRRFTTTPSPLRVVSLDNNHNDGTGRICTAETSPFWMVISPDVFCAFCPSRNSGCQICLRYFTSFGQWCGWVLDRVRRWSPGDDQVCSTWVLQICRFLWGVVNLDGIHRSLRVALMTDGVESAYVREN